MSKRYRAGGIRLQCAVNGCTHYGVQRHHAAGYHGPEDWATILVCVACHETMHDLHVRLRRAGVDVSIGQVTIQYLMAPELAVARARRYERQAEPLTNMQLGFGDQIGPAGDYWRELMQTLGYEAPPHRPWREDEAA